MLLRRNVLNRPFEYRRDRCGTLIVTPWFVLATQFYARLHRV